MSVLDVRTSIIESLQKALPNGVTVLPHGGRFESAAEIQRFAVKAPTVLVACVRIPLQNPGGGRLILPAGWAIFVVTKDKPGIPRDQAAIALVEAIVGLLSGNAWGRSDVGTPQEIDSRNLYSGAIDTLGIALWGISFKQQVTSVAVDASTLANFVTFHEDIDMAPADGVIDISQTTTLPQE